MSELITAIKEFIQPGMVVLIPFLYLIGLGLKKTTYVKDNLIPATLGGVGIIVAAMVVFCTCDVSSYKDVLTAITTALVQGVLCAGCAVYVNQAVVKQPQKGDGK